MAADGQTKAAGRSRLGLWIGLGATLAGVGAGFATVQLGHLDPVLSRFGATRTDIHAESAAHAGAEGADPVIAPVGLAHDVAFVPLAPITLNVGTGPTAQILRFGAQLEVPAGRAAEVTHLMPRIMDVLNVYLRALDPHELQEASAILRLRGQMLRRAQIVTGPGLVNDLLISEFVMN